MSNVAPPGFNFAHFAGIYSVAGAVVFTLLYIAALVFYVAQSIRRRMSMYYIMTFFCMIRVAAFATRAVLAGSDKGGQSLDLLIANEVIYSVGFFSLIYSAFTLVLARESAFELKPPRGPISLLTRNRALFRLSVTAAVALGITGTCQSSLATEPGPISLGHLLRKISTIIFLVLTVLVAYQTLLVFCTERRQKYSYEKGNEPFGVAYGAYILVVVSALLLTRESFLTATVGNSAEQNNEHVWYPLAALPEFLVVCLFATAGLVPNRADLPT